MTTATLPASWQQFAGELDPVTGLYFNDEDHTACTQDGRRVPRYSEITSALGLVNFDRVPRDVILNAQQRGSRVHKAAMFLGENSLDWDSVSEEDKPYVDAACAFLDDAKFEALAMERRVYSSRYDYCGTVDLLGFWNGQFAISDYTTGDAWQLCKPLQLGAYAGAVREKPPTEWWDFVPTQPIVCVSIELKKNGKYSTKEHAEALWFPRWLACRTVYTLGQELGRFHR